MPNGGVLRLSASGRFDDALATGEAVIRVEDQGVGIAPEELDGIFQPFRGGFERGTGLGLAIVHRIVSDYGGEVLVTSKRGIGTRVDVKLPLKSPASDDARAMLN
jgi:signal transduction histidine kinase